MPAFATGVVVPLRADAPSLAHPLARPLAHPRILWRAQRLPPRAAMAPGEGYVPKREVGVTPFLTQEPECDGRGVVVAVLDTGVDPGAPGLRVGPEGGPKVIDCVDCTGGGDVRLVEAKTRGKGEIIGGSGRVLRVSDEVWESNEKGVWRVGVKSAYALLPSGLVRRLKMERKKAYHKTQRAKVDTARRAVEAAKERKAAKDLIEELEARVAALDVDREDPGPMYDCVVFWDGERHRAVVDTDESGDLTNAPVMEDYHVRCRYATLYDLCNYAVNIYDEGKVLSIVVDSGSHGTHVAGIIGAYYPDEPHMNGMAPGASIVSLKIGDTRLGGMETHQGLTRALAYLLRHTRAPEGGATLEPGKPKGAVADTKQAKEACQGAIGEAETKEVTEAAVPAVQAGGEAGEEAGEEAVGDASEPPKAHVQKEEPVPFYVDAVNMSFGEPTRRPNQGRFVDLVTQLVRERNVVFMCSAGNKGPALTSVSAPGGTTDALIGIGAYVSPGMLREGYSLLDSDLGEANLVGALSADGDATGSFVVPEDSVSTSTVPAIAAGAVPGMPYTWSSRGPAADGGGGVSLCAPGGAIAAIPQWNLSRKRLMNGTSMASPAACGAAAVLLSFLKTKGIAYTSDSVRVALENSARPLGLSKLVETGSGDQQRYTDDLVFAGGAGSIDVLAARELMESVFAVEGEVDAVAQAKGKVRADTEGGITQHDPRGVSETVRSPVEWRYDFAVQSTTPMVMRSSGAGQLASTRGVYLRGATETQSVQRMSIALHAVRDDQVDLPANKAALAAMETTVFLEATEPWVTVPHSVLLYGSGRSFPIVIDPKSLQEGAAHYAEIRGYVAASSVPKYCVVRIPVTVVKPEVLKPGSSCPRTVKNVTMSSGAVLRKFYEPPATASYAVMRVVGGSAGENAAINDQATRRGTENGSHSDALEASSVSDGTVLASETPTSSPSESVGRPSDSNTILTPGLSSSSRFIDVHCVQVEPGVDTCSTETRHMISLVPGCVEDIVFPVRGGTTLEVAIGHRWSSMGISHISTIDITFCGLTPRPSALHMVAGGTHFPRITVTNALPCVLGRDNLDSSTGVREGARGTSHATNPHLLSSFKPRGVLNALHRPVSPSTSSIKALAPDRDVLPNCRQISILELEYAFEVKSVSCRLSVTFPGLNGSVYESLVEGGPYVTIHDGNKALLRCSDIYPETFSVTKKGTYYCRASVRHDDIAVLEGLKDTCAVITYSISQSLRLDQASTPIIEGTSKYSGKGRSNYQLMRGGLLEPGETSSFLFMAPIKSRMPSWAEKGDTIVGDFWVDEASLGSGRLSKGSSGKHAGMPTYSIAMVVDGSGKGRTLPWKSTSADSSSNQTDSNSSKEDKASAEKEKEEEKDKDKDDTSKSTPKPSCVMKNMRLKGLKACLKESKLADFDTIAATVPSDEATEIDFLRLHVQRLDADTGVKGDGPDAADTRRKAITALVSAADALIVKLDAKDIAGHFGLPQPDADDDGKAYKEKKALLVATVFRKTRALFEEAELADGGAAAAVADSKSALEVSFKELQQWRKMDGDAKMLDSGDALGQEGSAGLITAESMVMFVCRRRVAQGHYALALKTLDAFMGSSVLEGPTPKKLAEYRLELFEKLEWDHIVSFERRSIMKWYPDSLEPF